ncbi:hypothetical protein PPERSA_07993 [Pseudocohnilembus persalinus]|uniref:EGF-like domain-containing protein n=1 Tax=Pseudocohnilembus persalinus TaxID=266149 RepID=A0A0V0QI24_PSEPJ|nr:hypothetical protein PPERSA_07993 [Pseudocohnilembus persalinus]|eukprot:KRX01937.1 hypothetical protein PPERSA_07993 [Pseudocohnilembus persalinus]
MDYENYPRYFLDEPITFNAELNYIQCDSNAGEITYVEDQSFYTIWQIIDSTSVASDLETVTANYQQFISWEYDPWDLATYNGYQIRLKATSNGVEAVQARPFDVVEYPYLMCYIAGGSRTESVNNDLLIEANVLNFDVTDALQNSGVTYNWRCLDVMQYNNCVDNTGTVLTFANSASLTIPANTLEPYQTYRFRLDASITTPSNKQCYYIVYITILDVEQTLQLIDFPEHIQAGSVNLNDVFAITVDLDGFLNYDEPIYNFAFIYNDQVIANQTVKYETFNIRLMDYFDSVIVSDPYIQLRISVQSPYEYQPNMMSLRLYLNYPPQNGVLAVSDAISGTALSTSYTFQTYGWTDYNFDYSYRFSYYLSRDYYDEEVERGYNPLMSEMNIICDYSFRSVCSSYLPLPIQDDSDGNYYAVIMVQARDTLGGISNVTQAIQIQPSTKTRVNEIDALDSLYRKVLFSQKEEKVKKLVQIAHQLRQIDEEGCSVCSGNGVCDAVTQQCQCETGYYMRDCSMEKSDYDTYSTFKMEVLGSLMDLREKQLQLGYEEQIVKAQYSLLDDKYLGVTFNQTFVESYINEMDTYINSKISGKIDEIVDNNYIYKAKYKFDIDIDSIHRILKHLYYQFDAFAYSLNNTSYYSSRRQLDSFAEFQRLKYYKQLVNLTRDCGYQLHRMTQPNDKIYIFEGKMFNDKMTVMSTKYILDQILDYDIETDVINFSQTGPDIEGDGNVHVYDVMVQGYEVNPYRYEPTFPYPEQDTQCQDIDVFRQNTPEREISIEVKAKYEFDAINTENPDYNICISRQYNGVWLPPTWTSTRCNTTVLEDSSGDYNVFCTCFDLNPVSVVDDYMCNFSNCQYEEDDFRWYESLMLYTLIVFFLFFWYLLYKAYIYDKIYMYKVTLEIPDSEEEPESEEDEKDEKDRLKVGNVFEYIQGSRRGKIKRHKKRTAGDEGEDIVVEDRGGKTEVDADELEQEEVYNDVYFKQNVCWAIYKLHELLEIFFFYDPDCRRVFRVFFWYSKGMFMAGLIGTLLDKDLYLWYIVMYIGLFINIYDGLISIMKQLMRRPQFILKIIGLNLGIFSLIAALYMIIICNQWDNLADANEWAYIFLCLYFIDTMSWQPLLIFTKTVILNLAIGKGNRCARFIKWLFIFYEENIFFRNLLNQAKNVFG